MQKLTNLALKTEDGQYVDQNNFLFIVGLNLRIKNIYYAILFTPEQG
jgi:hypothetical protein